jgi:hypothetical protein
VVGGARPFPFCSEVVAALRSPGLGDVPGQTLSVMKRSIPAGNGAVVVRREEAGRGDRFLGVLAGSER